MLMRRRILDTFFAEAIEDLFNEFRKLRTHAFSRGSSSKCFDEVQLREAQECRSRYDFDFVSGRRKGHIRKREAVPSRPQPMPRAIILLNIFPVILTRLI